MLPAPNRLRERWDFASVVRGPGGTRAGSRLLVVHATRTDARAGCPPRVGFVVSRAVGNAVVRNRTKRRLRALVAGAPGRGPGRGRPRRAGQPGRRGCLVRGTRLHARRVVAQGGRSARRCGVSVGRVIAAPLVWLIRGYQTVHQPAASADLPVLPVVLGVRGDRPRAVRTAARHVDGGPAARPVPPVDAGGRRPRARPRPGDRATGAGDHGSQAVPTEHGTGQRRPTPDHRHDRDTTRRLRPAQRRTSWATCSTASWPRSSGSWPGSCTASTSSSRASACPRRRG